MRALLLALPLLLANTGEDPTIPAPIRAMLDAAIASGNEGEVATIVKYARVADPASADMVTQLASDWRQERLAVAQRRLQEAHFLDLVKGRAELGGYVSQGNTENVGVTAAIDVRREGLDWRHKLTGRADYQESLGQVTQERYLIAYEPNFKLDSRAYLYGAAQYEHDRFSGFDDRVSLSAGAGYRAINSPAVRIDLELGPAYRRTRFIDKSFESNLAARGSVDFSWKLSQAVTLTQNAAAYIQEANSTVAAKSALATKLIGPLSAQFSYSLQYESMPPLGRKTTDTISRAALVVDF